MRKRPMVIAILGLGLSVQISGGCSRTRSTTENSTTKDVPAAAIQSKEPKDTPAKQEAGKSNEVAPITYKEIRNDDFGFSIQIPSQSKPLSCDEFSCTYSYLLPDGMFAIHVNVAKATGRTKTIADAIRNATMIGQKAVAEKKEFPNGDMMVVKAPQGLLQEIWYFAEGPRAKLRAKCSGPAKMLDVLRKICTSIKAK